MPLFFSKYILLARAQNNFINFQSQNDTIQIFEFMHNPPLKTSTMGTWSKDNPWKVHPKHSESAPTARSWDEGEIFPRSSDKKDEGIFVPYFLQPLLGLDFVPYMPNYIYEEMEENPSIVHAILTDKDLEDLGLGLSFASSDDLVAPMKNVATNDDEDLLERNANVEVSLSHQSLATPSSEDTMEFFSPNKRFKKPVRKFLKNLVKGPPRRSNSSSKKKLPSSIPKRTNSWGGITTGLEDIFGEMEIASPEKNCLVNTQNHLEWIEQQQEGMEKHQAHLSQVQIEVEAMQAKTVEIHRNIDTVQSEVIQLQKAFKKSQQRLQQELNDFETAKSELARLETSAEQASVAVAESIHQIRLGPGRFTPLTPPINAKPTFDHEALTSTPKVTNHVAEASTNLALDISGEVQPLRRRASTAPTLRPSPSLPFMRVHDLEMESRTNSRDNSLRESSLDSSLSSSTNNSFNNNGTYSDFVFIDHNVAIILENLTKLGYAIATDETDRFTPTRETERFITNYNSQDVLKDWPIKPWHAAQGSDVLIWTGGVDHNGFGSGWPVCKARGLIKASPRVLLDYLLDSSKVKEYNKMSQGREDLLVIQEGIHTTVAESKYGFAGQCKITKSLNKPKFLPTTIEMLSLNYTQPVKNAPGSYIVVQRSVFEDDSGEHKGSTKHTIRSEMLLGVILIRPLFDEAHQICELTNITHVYSPGVPEMIAKRVAPTQAANMIRAIQNVFKP